MKTFIALTATALLAAGCADAPDPVSSTDGPEAAAKLTLSGAPAGGHAETPNRQLIGGDELVPAFQTELRFDQPLELEDLTLAWRRVEDSRCPDGVSCVWEGEVAIVIETVDAEQPDSLRLVLSSRDEASPRGRIGDYAVHLLGVSPYPEEGVETQRADYVASLNIVSAKTPPRRGRIVMSGERAGGGKRRPPVIEEPPFPPPPKPDPLPPEIAAELNAAQERWQQLQLASYDYQYQRLCFCVPDYTRPMRVEVRDHIVVNASYVDDGTPVPDKIRADIPTIDDLFKILQDAVDRPAFSLRAAYDAEQGFPNDVFIDFDAFIADEEHGFLASDLVPLEE